jgi:hypothetical protein
MVLGIFWRGTTRAGAVAGMLAGLGLTVYYMLHMIGLGLLAQRPGTAAVPDGSTSMGGSAPPVPAPASERSGRPSQQRYQDAYPIATQLTASLGLRGFRLNLAVEAAGSYEQLAELAPKIKDAVGADKFVPLERALHG